MNHKLWAATSPHYLFKMQKLPGEGDAAELLKVKVKNTPEGRFFNQVMLYSTIQGVPSANIYQYVQYLIKIYFDKIQIQLGTPVDSIQVWTLP